MSRPLYGVEDSPISVAPPTEAEIFDASFDNAFKDTLLMSAARNYTSNRAMENGPLESPEVINEQFPGLNVTEPKTKMWAQQQSDSREETRKNQELINRASGFGQGLIGFMGSIAGSMSDPVEFAVGSAIGAGFGALVKSYTAAELALAGGEKAVQSIIPTILEQGLGNISQNLISETFVQAATKKEGLERTALDSFNNVIVSSAFGTVLSVIPHALSLKLGKFNPNNHLEVLNTTKVAIDTGKSPTAVLNALDRNIDKDFKMTTEVKESIYNSIKDINAKEKIFNSPDIPTMFRNLQENVEAGIISKEETLILKHELESSGFDTRKYYMADKDGMITISKEAQAELKTEFNKPENDINFHPEVNKIMLEPQKNRLEIQEPIVTKQKEEIDSLNKMLDDHELQGKLTKAEREEFKDIKMQKDELDFAATKAIHDCWSK